MEVTRIRVESFKSLYELDTVVDHMTVVTGPNGSGKSNLVDAFTFLSDTYRHGLEFAVSRSGGYENIAHRRTRRAKRPILFEVEIRLSGAELLESTRVGGRDRSYVLRGDRQDSYYLVHGFSFRASSQKLTADFSLVEEHFTLRDQERNEIVRFDVVAGELSNSAHHLARPEYSDVQLLFRPFLDQDFAWERWGRTLEPTELLVASWRYGNVLSRCVSYLSRIAVFQLSPHISRTAGVTTPNAELGRHGDNLPGAAFALQRGNAKAWREIESAMKAIMPELESISITTTEDRRLALQFRAEGVGKAWNANEVSDGTIQALSMLVALLDPRSSMLIIEEPENAVHPWILRKIVDISARANRQVLFTTHSPVLLDDVESRSIFLMWMREGRSYLKRLVDLDIELQEGLISGDISPFSLYDSGFFPTAVPRGLSSE